MVTIGTLSAVAESSWEALNLMFSWVTNLSTNPMDAEAMWAVISSARPNQIREGWAALVSAMVCPATGEFAFEFDSRLGRLGDSILIRFRSTDLQRMVTRPATVIARVDPPGELSQVRALVDECACGAADCEATVCFEAGRFIRRRHELRAAA